MRDELPSGTAYRSDDPQDPDGVIAPATRAESTVRPEERGYTSPDTGEVLIYPHGFCVRLRSHLPKAEVLERFRLLSIPRSAKYPGRQTCGLEKTSNAWYPPARSGNDPIFKMRGSTHVTQRRPRNKGLALARANAEWKTTLYTVAVDPRGEDVFIDLAGVRYGDVATFMETFLDHGRDEYSVAYCRRLERYMVLLPHEARRLARDLDSEEIRGKGRTSRKSNLLKDLEIAIPIRTRARSVAKLNMYRIERGATCAYKCEISLRGESSKGKLFTFDSIPLLDHLLLRLVRKFDLHPVAKPARWEPQEEAQFVNQIERKAGWIRVSQKVTRGRCLRGPAESNPSPLLGLDGKEGICALLDDADRIRTQGPSRESGKGGSTSEERMAESHEMPHEKGDTRSLLFGEQPLVKKEVEGVCQGLTIRGWTRVIGSEFRLCAYTHEARSSVHSESPARQTEAKATTSRPSSQDAAIVQEVQRVPGMLSEVVLPIDANPLPFVKAMLRIPGHRVGVAGFSMVDGDKPQYSPLLARVIQKHPVTADSDYVVIHVDPSVNAALTLDDLDNLDGLQEPWDDQVDPSASNETDSTARGLPDGPAVEESGYWDEDGVWVPREAEGDDPDSLANPSQEIDFTQCPNVSDQALKVGIDRDTRDGRESELIISTARWFASLMEGFREICELTGKRIILVSADLRKHQGGAPSARKHLFNDDMVRSSLGDAGRYWCHTRYLVTEQTCGWRAARNGQYRAPKAEVYLLKDEAEGIPGRIIFKE